jgi:hypothetical protein
MNQDLEHLKLLTIFHYVVAGLMAIFACFPLIHFVIGLLMVSGAFSGSDGPPRVVGVVFMVIAGIIILVGWTIAALVFVAGRSLARRTRYTFCLVVAGLECLFMPIGTALGAFTIVVLMRESVKALFGQSPPARPASGGQA